MSRALAYCISSLLIIFIFNDFQGHLPLATLLKCEFRKIMQDVAMTMPSSGVNLRIAEHVVISCDPCYVVKPDHFILTSR